MLPARRCPNVGPSGRKLATGGTKLASRMAWQLPAQQSPDENQEHRQGDALLRVRSFDRDQRQQPGNIENNAVVKSERVKRSSRRLSCCSAPMPSAFSPRDLCTVHHPVLCNYEQRQLPQSVVVVERGATPGKDGPSRRPRNQPRLSRSRRADHACLHRVQDHSVVYGAKFSLVHPFLGRCCVRAACRAALGH